MSALLGLWLLAAAAHPAAGPEPLLVAVGSNLGLPGEEPLRYAQRDAQRFAELMIELGAARRERVYVLAEAGPAELERTLLEVKGRVAELEASGRPTLLVLYYAGHGDARSLHSGGVAVERDWLLARVHGIPAATTLVILDACAGVGATRAMGVTRGLGFEIAAAPLGPSGRALITSSSPGEPAHESDELGGAVFSHFFFSGLRGPADVDGDQQVSLDEAYRYAYSRTILRTAAGPSAVQRPGFALELAGAGALVLTRLGAAGASLRLPPGADTRFFVYSLPSGSLIAEVPGEAARPATIAVPAGRYLIQRRAPGAWGLARVELPYGGPAVLAAEDFSPVDYQRLALRGGALQVSDLIAGLTGVADWLPGSRAGLGAGANLGLAWARGALRLEAGLSLARSALTHPRYDGQEYRLGLQASALWGWVGTWYALRGGGGLSLLPTWQELRREVGQGSERFWTTAGGPHLALAAALSLGSGLALELAVQGVAAAAQAVDRDQTRRVVLRPLLRLGLGVSYAL